MARIDRSLMLALALTGALSGALSIGCRKKAEVTAEDVAAQGALTEQSSAGSVVWSIKPDGQVRIAVKGPDGKPMETGVTGGMSVKPPVGALALATVKPVEGSGGVLTATLPPFTEDLTELRYGLKIGNASFDGVMHVPRGGTQELLDSARATEKSKLEGKKGPHGGVIQVVGLDRVEILGDKASALVRVYLLDAMLQPAPIGERKLDIKLGLVGARSQVLDLLPNRKENFYEGMLRGKIEPRKITVALVEGGVTRVALCGWQPGRVVPVGQSAPVIGIFINDIWGGDAPLPTPGGDHGHDHHGHDHGHDDHGHHDP
ncbi:hypothetical protein [Chondromyces apiculatus]|uniref:Uncharacterized protein n=1 Tax=Chondromyces apiculatus DSM 436 TaxID=1192034 RepID=A0A017T8D8_9BACT|nr:hypothetical protein [Chondromyces apiculatus]EYF04876.1 Hypothetical protein CAP_3902 [Chondromyces apiculatus DSM 436]